LRTYNLPMFEETKYPGLRNPITQVWETPLPRFEKPHYPGFKRPNTQGFKRPNTQVSRDQIPRFQETTYPCFKSPITQVSRDQIPMFQEPMFDETKYLGLRQNTQVWDQINHTQVPSPKSKFKTRPNTQVSRQIHVLGWTHVDMKCRP